MHQLQFCIKYCVKKQENPYVMIRFRCDVSHEIKVKIPSR